MVKVFVAGSMNIKHLDRKVKERLDSIIDKGFEVVVGDADGADTSIQQHLFAHGVSRATVYCSGERPRNNIGAWHVHHVATTHAEGSRAFFTAKDLHMAEAADYGLMIWDAKSTGTLSNVIELLARSKKSVVFVNKEKAFKNVGSVADLESLVGVMSAGARLKAEEKIKLSDRIAALKQAQQPLFG
jgi:hypothetical protein